MPFTGKVGDILYISDSGGGHRYVILTETNSNNEVVLVNFTSPRLWKDNSAVFRGRDDKRLFIVETSVRFSDASLVLVDELKEKAKTSENKRKYLYCPEGIVQRIVKGAFQSDFIPIGIIKELKAAYPVEYETYYEENN
ncbi:MAG: hypothetical protein P8105_12525 [Dehalococcoidia bacterium]